jgi:hypothetical protein
MQIHRILACCFLMIPIAVFVPHSLATTKGLSQIVTPDLQLIALREQLQAERREPLPSGESRKVEVQAVPATLPAQETKPQRDTGTGNVTSARKGETRNAAPVDPVYRRMLDYQNPGWGNEPEPEPEESFSPDAGFPSVRTVNDRKNPKKRASRSHCPLHRIRKLQHHVISCRTLRSRLRLRASGSPYHSRRMAARR